MPEYLPFPYPVVKEGGEQKNREQGGEKRVEYRVPVEGIRTAQMLRERNSVPSNEMFAYEARVVEGAEGK